MKEGHFKHSRVDVSVYMRLNYKILWLLSGKKVQTGDMKCRPGNNVCIKSPCTSISASSAVLTVHGLLIQTL